MTAKKPTPSKAASPAAKATKPAAVEREEEDGAGGEGRRARRPRARRPRRRGKKGKADDKLAKPEASDVDLSDLESELEGEPVVVAEADAPPRPSRCA